MGLRGTLTRVTRVVMLGEQLSACRTEQPLVLCLKRDDWGGVGRFGVITDVVEKVSGGKDYSLALAIQVR